MLVWAADFELHLPSVQTIKERRQILNRIKDKLKGSNMSVVDLSQDCEINRARIGVAYVLKNYSASKRVSDELEKVLYDSGAIVITFSSNVFELEG
jgi:hypothetical protein